MPTFCTERPNRTKPRTLDLERVAKMLCHLTRRGATKAHFDQLYFRECPGAGRDRTAEEERALQVAQEALESTRRFLDADAAMLERFLGVFSLFALTFRFIARFVGAPGAIVTAGIIAAESAAKARLATIVTQRAANDAALEIVRRAAANEARFAIRAGSR